MCFCSGVHFLQCRRRGAHEIAPLQDALCLVHDAHVFVGLSCAPSGDFHTPVQIRVTQVVLKKRKDELAN